MSQINNDFNSYDDLQTAMFADCLANSKEIFQLIDTVFPLDSCRHYQVLPLELQGRDLTLGMLDPSNQESLRFINSIAKVFQYKLNLKLIDTQTHQIILDSYPQSSQSSPKPQNSDENKTVIDASFNIEPIPLNENQLNRRRLIDSAPTIITQPQEELAASKLNEKLPDLPPDLDFLRDLDLTPQPSAKPAQDASATLYEIPPEFLHPKTHNFGDKLADDKPTIIGGDPAQLLAAETFNPEIVVGEAQISDLIPETPGNHLEVTPEEAEEIDFLPQLIPQLSWHKLLEQAFKHQAEQIHLTRYSDRGSIIVYKNEEPQSFIERVPLPIFCSLIDEIKRMARLPQEISAHPQKVVLERFYDQERILLRLEFMLHNDKEKVMIQILRDQALRIYEQQQLDKISEQALQLAQQLEKTLRKIQACFDTGKLTNLRELQTVQSRINHQLRLLDK
jgi:type II secretory ATPase GspE/PulE/Tfp pilus assembly ATPase PilB-like protein